MSNRDKSTEKVPCAISDIYSTLVSMDALLKMEGPLADMVKSGLILIPVGKSYPPFATRFLVGLVLEAFLSTHPDRRNYFYFERNFGGMASVVAGEGGLYAPGKKDCLLRAAENPAAIASGIKNMPQPVVVIRWNTWYDEMIPAVRKIAAAVVAENPEFKLYEQPGRSAMYLSNIKTDHNFYPD